MQRTLLFIFSGAAIVLSLSSCSDTRDALGMTNKPPDEFAVVDHPPLSMPPDYALRPPRPGVESFRGDNPAEKAAKALYGESNMQAVPQQGVSRLSMQQLTPAEQAVVAQSGADKADPTIRTQLAGDKGQVVGSRKLIDNLLFWKKPQEPGTVVNATAEANRLKAAKQQGLPVNSGATTAIDKGTTTAVQ